MAFTKVIKFKELVRKLSENGCDASLCGLLNIQIPLYEYSELPDQIMNRLKDTWWEVSWPDASKDRLFNENAIYSYLADSVFDVLRFRPDADLPLWEKMYGFSDHLIDNTEDLEYIPCLSRLDTVSDEWEYLNYDLYSNDFERY